MHGADRGGRHELDQAVPVRDGVEGIPGRSVEPQRRRGHVPVDGKGCPREGSGAERGFVQPRAGIAKAATVAAEHFHVGHQVMPEGHGLGALKVGEAGHDGSRVGLGLVEKSLDQGRDLLLRPVMGLANPEAHVDGDLVVAAAGGVQAGRGFARDLPQAALDIHMNIFQGLGVGHRAGLDLPQDPLEARVNRIPVGGVDDPLPGQHGRVRQGALDVLGGQAPVEVDGCVDRFHEGAGGGREPAAPHGVGAGRLGFIAHGLRSRSS